MKDKVFYAVLAALIVSGIAVSAAMMIYGYNLWKDISIVEMIANWG